MRALFLVHNLPNRGSYFRALEIARRMALRGHYVEFICTSSAKMYRRRIEKEDLHAEPVGAPNGVLVRIESPYRTFFNDRQEGWSVFDNSYRIYRALESRWDLVYGFSHKPNILLPALATKIRGAKIVLDWSDWWGTPEGLYHKGVIPSDHFQALARPIRLLRRGVFAIEEFIEPNAYAIADAATLISEEFLRHPRAPRDLASKSIIMHSGSPLREIRPMPKTEARRACGLSLPDDAIVLGYIANFHTGERLLLEAFARICEQRSDIHLLAVGSGFEKFTPELHARIKDRLHHSGMRPFSEVAQYLAASDILLLPLNDVALDRARYPHKLSDYVAAGRPIVACDVGETGRILRRYEIGLLTPPESKAFAVGIAQMIHRREEWDRIGKQTRHAAEEHFDWDRISARLFEFFEQRLQLRC